MKKQNLKSKISNMKGSSGITLVALIITIIILLILAVVAIGAVNNTGIIQYAENSADEYKDGRDKENTTLGNYMDVLKHYNSTKEEILWVYVEEDEGLVFIGNVIDLDLSGENKEVKAYIAKFNENTEKFEWSDEIINVKLTNNLYIECFGSVKETLKIGKTLMENNDFILSSFKAPNLILDEGITTIPAKRLEGKIKSIVLPSSLTTIEYRGLAENKELTSITLPSKVSFVDRDAFEECSNLTNITIKKAKGSLDLSNSGLTQEQIDNIVWAPEGE